MVSDSTSTSEYEKMRLDGNSNVQNMECLVKILIEICLNIFRNRCENSLNSFFLKLVLLYQRLPYLTFSSYLF